MANVVLIGPDGAITADQRPAYLEAARGHLPAELARLMSGRPVDRRRNMPQVRQIARALREVAKELDAQ